MHQIENAELNLSGKIYGVSPVQAEGTVNGFLFYFRARYDEWTFAISEHAEIDPVDIQLPESGKQYGYFAVGKYGTEFDYKASYMEFDVALDIIQRCCAEYQQGKRL
ncbi:MAG: hypothetical protein IPP99_04515 [Chitinophagaceae bacterium]|nr:hypothetical protein [Chitinophagaceae bacterium]